MERIQGRNPVMEAIKAEREIDSITIAKGAEGSIKKIVGMAKDRGILIKYADKKKLDEMCESTNHQGVVAIVSEYGYYELDELMEYCNNQEGSPFLIVLDGITDPHNLGAIIRTVDAVGAHGVIIPKRRSVGITPVVVKSSAGAVEHVPVCRVSNIVNAIKELKEHGLWIAALDMDGDSVYRSNMTGPIALVLGSEGKGISRLVKENCDFAVKLPMEGKVSSLNASVAGGVIMYEVLRQRTLKEG
ncbi:23S rRNA (guanosine2251-2'-O)-methyltransferase [Peptoclostridium litorale DSM 5388]|uniref:RNA 2'-O ribose methyltransferase substrate binding family protein n=1 Tax=Peptoclostridium litorale DSM 5388 TaxID=1121324 RepID=A0A069RC14_PEPLI|nr:23S rRNA (guanosine(2251)-2'-O)-methyltransferase RlmB [Peptoclostridium litorale]KDR94323.1 RNA 2'-O ribose methyltransferase substrate binding family protein [Peptoclostridium litorale DSM 5388]SIO29013.1 23S rRNA (guanosine2251-2'-O)-methyltransferase [Peptoclostridium litorale DSM 5388]